MTDSPEVTGPTKEQIAAGEYPFESGTCHWCGDEGAIYRDTGYCETCDGEICPCIICGEDRHIDYLCRHIFRDVDYEFSGAGTGWLPSDSVRESFLALANEMPEGFASELETAIDREKFHTWFVAPLIGGGCSMFLRGVDLKASRRFGDALAALAERENADALADGYGWLASLYDDRTPKANAITLDWLRAMEAAKPKPLEEAMQEAQNGPVRGQVGNSGG